MAETAVFTTTNFSGGASYLHQIVFGLPLVLTLGQLHQFSPILDPSSILTTSEYLALNECILEK